MSPTPSSFEHQKLLLRECPGPAGLCAGNWGCQLPLPTLSLPRLDSCVHFSLVPLVSGWVCVCRAGPWGSLSLPERAVPAQVGSTRLWSGPGGLAEHSPSLRRASVSSHWLRARLLPLLEGLRCVWTGGAEWKPCGGSGCGEGRSLDEASQARISQSSCPSWWYWIIQEATPGPQSLKAARERGSRAEGVVAWAPFSPALPETPQIHSVPAPGGGSAASASAAW